MFGRIWLRLVLAAAALAVAVAAPAAEPAINPARIVAIGDLHGDFAAWRDIARAAGLIDAQGRWTGGKTVLVQTGDVADRGPDTLKIVTDLMRLQREAARAGGRVVALVGNHEAMNLTDDLRYVTPGEYAAFADRGSAALRDRLYAANRAAIEACYRKRGAAMTDAAVRAAWLAATPLGQIEHQTAWHPTGRIGRWIAANPAVLRLGDTLFVHGGLNAAYAKLPLTEINARVAAALKARDTAPAAIINDPAGPLWYRGLVVAEAAATADEGGGGVVPPIAPSPALSPEAELDAVLAAQGAKRIVIGHTPIKSGIAVLYGGRLVRIDTGISAYYGGTLSYLEIIDGALVPHTVARSAPVQRGGR